MPVTCIILILLLCALFKVNGPSRIRMARKIGKFITYVCLGSDCVRRTLSMRGPEGLPAVKCDCSDTLVFPC